jgi:hypothetical protein
VPAAPPPAPSPAADDCGDRPIERPAERLTVKAAAKQATRLALLAAATELLFHSPAPDPIEALRPVEIVRRAEPPRTTGAFYNIWPTHADFRRDLLHHLLRLEQYRHTHDAIVDGLGGTLAEDGQDVAETVRLAANLGFERFAAEPAQRFKQAIWAASGTDPDVRTLIAEIYSSVSDTMIPLYQRLLAATGRQMRAPHTLEELAVVLAALHEGLALRWSVQPEAAPDGPPPAVARGAGPQPGDDRRWSQFASTAFTLFMAMSEPV